MPAAEKQKGPTVNWAIIHKRGGLLLIRKKLGESQNVEATA